MAASGYSGTPLVKKLGIKPDSTLGLVRAPAGFRKLLARTGEGSEFPFPIHPHMLRHACGYKLAND